MIIFLLFLQIQSQNQFDTENPIATNQRETEESANFSISSEILNHQDSDSTFNNQKVKQRISSQAPTKRSNKSQNINYQNGRNGQSDQKDNIEIKNQKVSLNSKKNSKNDQIQSDRIKSNHQRQLSATENNRKAFSNLDSHFTNSLPSDLKDDNSGNVSIKIDPDNNISNPKNSHRQNIQKNNSNDKLNENNNLTAVKSNQTQQVNKLKNRYSRQKNRKALLFKRTKSRHDKHQEIDEKQQQTDISQSNRREIIRKPILNDANKKSEIRKIKFNKNSQKKLSDGNNKELNKAAANLRAGFEILKIQDQFRNEKDDNNNGEAQRKKIAGILDFIKDKYAPSRTPAPQVTFGHILIYCCLAPLCGVGFYTLCCQSHKRKTANKMNDEEMPFTMARCDQEEKELISHGFRQL